MTSIEAYKKFELKVNNINTASNIDISIGEFVLIYNEQQNKWTLDRYRGRSKDFDINDIQLLISTDKNLGTGTDAGRFERFSIPSDYLDYISAYAKAKKGGCTDRVLYAYKVKLNEIDLHLKDENQKPSFEYHETPLTISENSIQVYKTDFAIDSVFLTYYRFPKPIDIAGYTRLDGTASTNVDPELDDISVDYIIDWCALEVQRLAENPQGFQLSANRLIN
ncbi:MAG: hypothetical protein E6R03_17675 [Hyphomicrobiaceae bacterium]|nr:MAG: hypothetical protein E6R03_17675 [Hyphomicrobiaceae bacterium]